MEPDSNDHSSNRGDDRYREEYPDGDLQSLNVMINAMGLELITRKASSEILLAAPIVGFRNKQAG